MTKKLQLHQIKDECKLHNLDSSMIRAILKVECKSSGFLPDGQPKILFERHIFWRELGKIKFFKVRKMFNEIRPDLCSPHATQKGGYGRETIQHKRLSDAINLINLVLDKCDSKTWCQVRECALKSCSWGLSQIMGFNYTGAGYRSFQDFINDMYHSEQKQLKATINLLKTWNLEYAINNQDFEKIARKWNGSGYKKFEYDTKIKKYYNIYSS